MKSAPRVWTSRDAHFDCFPRTSGDDLDRFMDALPEHYWSGWRHITFRTLCLSRCERQIQVCGWPRWIPAWAARRSLAGVAARVGVGGEATVVTNRSVLL